MEEEKNFKMEVVSLKTDDLLLQMKPKKYEFFMEY